MVVDRPFQCEIWAVIKLLNKGTVGAREIHRSLCAMYREDNIMVVPNVYDWIDMFNDGIMSTHNDASDGRLSNTINDKTVNIVRILLDADWHYKLDNLRHMMVTQYEYISCSWMPIHTILIEHLEIWKVSACSVSHQLLETNWNQYRVVALHFLTQYELERDWFLHRMVTGDEIWVHYWTPISK